MAVTQTVADTWVNHLQFLEPRPTENGMVDGVFYGVLSVAGDASGGTLAQNGQLSRDRKEDWVYVMRGVNAQKNSATASDVAVSVATGPLVPTATAVNNAVFSRVGLSDTINNLSSSDPLTGGKAPWEGMPCFGDKRISGNYGILTVTWTANTNTVIYTVSMWGYLVRYNSFFRLQSLRNLPFMGVR